MNLKFRPHHFLCSLAFQGKGYSPEFIAGFAAICERLNQPEGDDIQIEITAHTDTICAPCPHKRGQVCTSQALIEGLDQAHAEILGIKPGEQISWGEAKQRIKTHMNIDKFNQACAPCAWKDLGVCEQALAKLRSEVKESD
jgi:uncharacterized protein